MRGILLLACLTAWLPAFAEPVIRGDLRAAFACDLRQSAEPVNRRVLGLCLIAPPFDDETIALAKPILQDASVRVWLHQIFDAKYMGEVMRLVKETGPAEVIGFSPLCSMPNIVARYESESEHNLPLKQQLPATHELFAKVLNATPHPDFPKGYGFTGYEVWNEPQFPANGAWPAADFARYTLDVSRRVRTVAPGIDVGVCLRWDREWPGWNERMLTVLAQREPAAASFAVEHPYDFFWIGASKTLGSYYARSAGMQLHREGLVQELQLLQRLGHGRWRLALTEWNTHPQGYGPPTHIGRDLAAALNLAGAVQMYWELGVDSAHFFQLHGRERQDGGAPHFALLWHDREGKLHRNPTYEALRLIGEAGWGMRLQGQVQSPTFAYPRKQGEPVAVPLVAGTAIFDAKAGQLRLLLLNRHAEAAIPVALDLANFQPSGDSGRLTTLSGATPEAEEPLLSGDQPVPLAAKSVTLPPHSFSVLTIAGICPETEQERVDRLLHLIREWNVCGIFAPDSTAQRGLDTPLPCAPDRVDLKAAYPGFDQSQALWTRLRANDSGFVDGFAPHRVLGLDKAVREHLQALAVSYVWSPEARPAVFSLGLDYWGRLEVNGERVLDVQQHSGGPVPDTHRGKATLKQGWNQVVVRVASGSGGMGFWCGLENPGDLRFSSDLPAAGAEPPAVGVTAAAASGEITLRPVAATFVSAWKDHLDQSFAQQPALEIAGPAAVRRLSYLRFDLSGLPAGARLESAALRLTAAYAKEAGQVRLAPVQTAWDEKCTWNSRPRTGPVLAAKADVATPVWTFAGDDLRNLAQGWLADPAVNHGLAVSLVGQGFAGISKGSGARAPSLVLRYSFREVPQ